MAKTNVKKGKKKEDPTEKDFYTPTDRTFVLSTQFDEFVASHPAVRKDKELKKKAKKISLALGAFYQEVGAKMV